MPSTKFFLIYVPTIKILCINLLNAELTFKNRASYI
jgi:hypothetical protein